jgi:adenylate kinase family enzyme/ribosomal protein S18 acetylase RimI-like enzyme
MAEVATRAGTALSTRRAQPEDAAAICAVLRASITELLAGEHRNDPQTLGAWLENKTLENALCWINADDRYAVVATEADTVCGFGLLKANGEIGLLYVAPGARFRGVSKALLAALEEHAAAWGLNRVTATSSFTALPFYRARGYQACGEPVAGFGVTRGCPVAKTLLPQRIVVVGTSCCGKTVFARRLAQSLGYSYVELDELFWGPQWTPKPDAEFRRLVEAAASAPRWVADGNYGRVRDILWPRATTVVWLNYSFARVLLRAFRRTLGRLITREPLWHGNKESVRLSFLSRQSILLWVITTFHRRRDELAGLRASGRHPHLSWVELRRPGDAKPYLRTLQPADVRD